jgi:excisionase family DNA binding protein
MGIPEKAIGRKSKMNSKKTDKLPDFKVDQAATILNCSRRTIFRLIEDGHLKKLKKKGYTFITGESLLNYLNKDLPLANKILKLSDKPISGS